MVRITVELVRRKSEHNECEIGTLEELSLHQEDVERIENLQHWCRNLQILLLQGNLIAKIENLHKLKKLEYLNLALNIIERVENLDGCESLNKLDLTLNFIGELTSLQALKSNIHLRNLFMTGNPCCDYKGYRDYVVATLLQLDSLDGTEITRTERLKALQNYDKLTEEIIEQQKEYAVKRKEQKERLEKWMEREYETIDDEEENQRFWEQTTEHAPETKLLIAEKTQRQKNTSHTVSSHTGEKKRTPKFFTDEGRPWNINQAKLKFLFTDDNPNIYVLEIAVYKFLDTSLIQVDVEPNYVRAVIKGKVFQLQLPEEVSTEKSIVQRSQTTGHLLIKMPKINQKSIFGSKTNTAKPEVSKEERKVAEDVCFVKSDRREMLEIGPIDDKMDFSKIIENNQLLKFKKREFEENPEVPPLE